MKICRDCVYFVYEDDKGDTCMYHQEGRVWTNPVYGNTFHIIDIPSNLPSKMRAGTEFKIKRWKNCGKNAKFFVARKGVKKGVIKSVSNGNKNTGHLQPTAVSQRGVIIG